VLSPEIATAIDAFQDAIDQRMAEANGANQPKQSLFHYTCTPSLMGIVTSEQFWLTSIFHMDDTEELKFGFNVSRSLLQEAMASKVGLTRAFCQVLLKAFDAQRIKELIAFYSISFGLRDDTQQWNRYAAEGRGVALGLKPKFFSPVPFEDPDNPKPEEELFYGKVSYGEAEARARHSVVINGAFDLIDRAQTAGWLRTEEEGDTFCQHLAATMYTEILWNCVTTKDSCWSHQNETRAIRDEPNRMIACWARRGVLLGRSAHPTPQRQSRPHRDGLGGTLDGSLEGGTGFGGATMEAILVGQGRRLKRTSEPFSEGSRVGMHTV